jgi:hypothetical protein
MYGTRLMGRMALALPMVAVLIGSLASQPAMAQEVPVTGCSQADLAAVVDDMAAQLRLTSTASYPRLQAGMRQLAVTKGWSEVEAEAKAQELLDDAESRALDAKAGELLLELDRKGPSDTIAASCARLAELKAIAAQLLEVTSAKSAHSLARLDIELGNKMPRQGPVPTEATLPPVAMPPVTTSARPTALPTQKPVPSKPPALPWETQTRTPEPAVAVEAGPLPAPPVAARPTMADMEFTQEDIRAAGRGVFGTISAELASVIEFAFKSYGRPNAYILGTEGGAALLAGLRYGEGTLVTKRDGERRIYWQGPSVGYDFGLAGSRTLVLIYNLDQPDAIMSRFGGVDGSAYLVGGVGLTVLKKGTLILAPIRTGLGLRVGANVGYLKFTPRPSFNPF